MCGLAAPVLFAVAVIAQGLWRPPYDHVRDPVSALAAGPNGWIQQVTFAVVGLLWMAHATGLHLGSGSIRWGAIGPALLGLAGLGMVGAGIFPGTDASGAFVAAAPHPAMAAIVFGSAGLGLIAIARRVARDPDWEGSAAYPLTSGILVLLLFVAIAGFAKAPDAPLRAILGLLQRAAVAVWFTCSFVLTVRLLRAPGPAI